MTVAELLEAFKMYDPNLEVFFPDSKFGDNDITTAEEREHPYDEGKKCVFLS